MSGLWGKISGAGIGFAIGGPIGALLGAVLTPGATRRFGAVRWSAFALLQAGTIGAAPAVMNAVIDALSGLGITDMAMPASPHNVWKAIQGASK